MDEKKQFDQEEEMRQLNDRLYKFIDKELSETSEPHIVGGVMAAALQHLWVALMGPESAADAFRVVAAHCEESDVEPTRRVVH